jgi:hypothetical protein
MKNKGKSSSDHGRIQHLHGNLAQHAQHGIPTPCRWCVKNNTKTCSVERGGGEVEDAFKKSSTGGGRGWRGEALSSEG